ncbi:PREDICTED: tyrosine decarboxylase 1-like isoform X2 [Tarenaya hassleriana]|uniref:tyrosine decarboxylase 1-like isoform X2 n=1 Tax=Tarenaya hassleriana TaxID=28532 RepID=UPI00053C9CAD|nr:PREDICTED: tyrosine decarboxylase 1-like isoform X2 [Tarenaya hassleriana]
MENGKMGLKPMESEQLREYGHRMVDFIADYYKSVDTFPVRSQVQPGYLHELLPDSAPEHPESLKDVLHDVERKIIPGITHWQSPRYFGYFPASTSVGGVLGEMLDAGLGVLGFTWLASPVATELEIVVLDWLAKLLSLPPHFLSSNHGNGGGGVIQATACEAVLVVLVAARDKFLRKLGQHQFPNLVVYASDQTHSSFLKACQIGGIRKENCRLLKTDSSTNYALSPDLVQEEISRDVAKGLVPFFICATVGTTSSAAVDPVPDLGRIAKRNGMWLHVDAAYAGNACICPELRKYIDGVEDADSFNMNAHKWLFTGHNCSPLWVKDRRSLIQALNTNPEYLKYKAACSDSVVDYKDWQIPLSRSFRSLKLWMVLRLYGSENLKSYIRNHINLAKHFEELVAQDPLFEVVTPRSFSLVCFRLAPKEEEDEETCNTRNHSLLEAVNSTGKLFLSHTVLSGKTVLRFAVGASLTEEEHVTEAWVAIREEASHLLLAN